MRIVVILFLLLVFSTICNAQICGPSRTKIYIVDDRGQSVLGVKLEFTDIRYDMHRLYGDWLTSKAGTYFIDFGDSKPTGFHYLRISADGYLTSEIKIEIKEAQSQIFRLVLQKHGSNKSNSFEELFQVRGRVGYSDGSPVAGAKVALSNQRREIFAERSNDVGEYMIEAPKDNYTFDVFRPDSSLAAKYEMFRVSSGTNHVDAVLQANRNREFVGSSLTCKPHTFLAGEFDCTLTEKVQ